MKRRFLWLNTICLIALSMLLVSCDLIPNGYNATTTVTVTKLITTTETPTATTPISTSPTGQITSAAIRWGTSPDRIIFTWAVSNLNPGLEYWVYPHAGFTENTGPFGSTPEDEASNLEGMYEIAVTHFRPALDGTGAWDWHGGKPTNPFGKLVLIAYDPAISKAYVVAISEPINTSAW